VFLQQHMERLMHQQSLERSHPRCAIPALSQLGATASVPNSGFGIRPNSSAGFQINSSRLEDAETGALLEGTAHRDIASPSSAVRQCQSLELPPSLAGWQGQPSSTAPRSDCGARPREQQRVAAAPRSDCGAGPREQSREQRGLSWRFGSRSRHRTESETQFDDTASVSSSTSSTTSRRSVGQSLLSAVKSVKYAMVSSGLLLMLLLQLPPCLVCTLLVLNG
jgi:hypothetical protein